MSRLNWADSIKHDLRDALDHVLAIKCSCDLDMRCHRCNAAYTLTKSLGYQESQAWAIVNGETTVARLELSRCRMEYAQALKDEMGYRYPSAKVSKVSVFESVNAGGRSGMAAADEGRGTNPPAARE